MSKQQLNSIPPDAEFALTAIGEAVRRARLARGDTQGRAAERIGAHVQTVRRIESGEPGVSAGHLLGMLAIYGRKEQLFALAEDDEQTRILAGRLIPERARTRRRKAAPASNKEGDPS